MNLLVIDAWFPTPDRDSASLRMFHLLKLLTLFGSVAFAADDVEARRSGRAGVEGLGAAVVTETVSEHLARCGATYDVIVLSRVGVAVKYLAPARHHAPHAKIIFDTTDLAYVRMFRGAKVMNNRALLRRAMETKKTELDAIRAADVTLVVSEAEQAMLAQEVPTAQVQIVSNIHSLHEGGRPFGERKGIVFIGAFPHSPNQDAMQFFCHDILPRVRETLPDATVTIVGSQPPGWLQAFVSKHFVVTGQVPDIEPLLNETRITIAPLRYGAGVKGKVLLSMSYGIPVAATTIAAEGLYVRHGRDILIADGAQEFAAAMHALYSDESLWTEIAANGRRTVAEHFSPEAANQALENVLKLEG